MNLFKKLGARVKSFFTQKVEELPVPPSREVKEALDVLERFAGNRVEDLSEPSTLGDYHSGDRPDNKRKVLLLASGAGVGRLRRIIKPSDAIQDEWAALRKSYGSKFSQALAHNADPDALAKLVEKADKAKLIRAKKAAARMVKFRLLPAGKQAVDNQVKEIMEWNEEALTAMEDRLTAHEKGYYFTKKFGFKKKPASRKPQKKKVKEVRLSPKRKTKPTKAKRK